MKPCASAMTLTGHRSNNEDAFVVDPELGLYAVADGMGGYEGGEIASHVALDELRSFLRALRLDPEHTFPLRAIPDLTPEEQAVDQAIRIAHRSVIKARTVRTRRMGTTIATLVQPRPGGPFVLAHVGDSRVYRMRDGELVQLTRDHSFLEALRQSGAIGPDETMPEHVGGRLTKALGVEGWDHPTVTRVHPAPGDRYLLCTDGLSGALGKHEIAVLLADRTLADTARCLVDAALARGSRDNITAVVVGVDARA